MNIVTSLITNYMIIHTTIYYFLGEIIRYHIIYLSVTTRLSGGAPLTGIDVGLFTVPPLVDILGLIETPLPPEQE